MRLITFAFIVLLCFSAFAMRPKPVPGFREVKTLPETMVAGSTYIWEVSLVNPKSESGAMDVTLDVTEENSLVGSGEFAVGGTLDACDNPDWQHDSLTLTFMEAENGTFRCQTPIEKRFNDVTLTISSVPNLMPGTYTFTLTVTLQYGSIT